MNERSPQRPTLDYYGASASHEEIASDRWPPTDYEAVECGPTEYLIAKLLFAMAILAMAYPILHDMIEG